MLAAEIFYAKFIVMIHTFVRNRESRYAESDERIRMERGIEALEDRRW